MQIRLWYRKATTAERVTTMTAVAIVAALLLASIVLVPDRDAESTVEAFGTDTGSTDDSSAPRQSAARGDPTDGDAPGTDPGAAPVPSGGQSTADAGGGDGGLPGEGEAGAPSSDTRPGTGPVALTASDRGVSPEAIKIGFLLQNAAGLNSAGFSTGQRDDGEQYVRALADWATREGRAGGRKVVPVFRYTDPTSVEDQAAACRAMVDDAKVFAVVDVAAMLDTAALDCLVNRNKGDTPFVHSVMWSRAWQARSGGNEISYQAAIDRISITWARDLAALGWFPKGATVGILGDKCPATEPTIVEVLAPALKAKGAAKVVFGNHDCNLEAVVSQPPNIATQFRLARVTHVLIVTNFVAAQVFISTAASQGYKPKYSASDWFLNTSDATSANFDPDQFDGAVGIASIGSMLPASGKDPYSGWETCSKIAVDAGLDEIPPGEASSAELLSLCDNFLLLVDALAAAGPNPTRAAWREAVTRLGDHPSAVFGRSRFAPDKLTGSDFVHTVRWQRGCRCWKSDGEFRPAAE